MADTTTPATSTSTPIGVRVSHWLLAASAVLGTITGFLSSPDASNLIHGLPWLQWVVGLGAVLTAVGAFFHTLADIADNGKVDGSV